MTRPRPDDLRLLRRWVAARVRVMLRKPAERIIASNGIAGSRLRPRR